MLSTYLNGEREEVDLLERLDLAVLDEAAQLGHRDPFLLLLAAPASTAPAAVSAAASSAPAAAITAPATAVAAAETASESTTIGWSSVRHSGGSEWDNVNFLSELSLMKSN